MLRSFLGACALTLAVAAPAHSASLICAKPDGTLTVKPKCKPYAETALTLDRLHDLLKVPTPDELAQSKSLTAADVNGLIAAYLACDERNKIGKAQHDAIVTLLEEIKSYAAGLSINTRIVPAAGVTTDSLRAAKDNFYDAVDAVMVGRYSKLPDLKPALITYLAQLNGFYPSTSREYESYLEGAKSYLTPIGRITVPDFQPEICGG